MLYPLSYEGARSHDTCRASTQVGREWPAFVQVDLGRRSTRRPRGEHRNPGLRPAR